MRPMMDLKVDPASCTGCGECVEACGFGAIQMKSGVAHVHDGTCARCMICVQACPTGSLRPVRVAGVHGLPDDALVPPRVVSSAGFSAPARRGGGRKTAVELAPASSGPDGRSRLN